MKLLWLYSLYLAGIIAGSNIEISWLVLPASLLPLPLVCFKRARKVALWGSLSLLLLIAGLASSSPHAIGAGLEVLAWYNNSGIVTINATIDRDIEIRDSSQHLHLDCSQVSSQGVNRSTTGHLLVYTSRYPEYKYGDELLITGKLEKPPVFKNEITGEVEFDYASYLANQGILSIMVYPEIQVISANNSNFFLSGLYDIKQKLAFSIERALPEPSSSLVCGILLGQRYKIHQDIQDDFSRTGAFHLLAISGLHLGIIATMTLSLGRAVLGRQGYIYIFLALTAIWLYAIVSGSGAPVIRAAVMASIFLLAELAGRQKSALPALALAASIMVAIDPKIINTTSFQMSFSAMAGIMLFYSSIRSWGQKILSRLFGEKRKLPALAGLIIDSLSASLAATIFVLPLTLHYFGIFSPLGPLVTLLLMPALIPIIAISMPVAVLGLFWPTGAMALGWLCWVFSKYTLVVTEWFSGWDSSYAENITFSGFLVIVYYSGMLAAYLVAMIWKRTKKHPVANHQMETG